MIREGEIEGVAIWPSFVFGDSRGQLVKTFGTDLKTSKRLGSFAIKEAFFTKSNKGVFRGMHLQAGSHLCNKIISVVNGNVTDVLVDVRKESDTFLNTIISKLDSLTPTGLFVPSGVAHGYLVEEEGTIFQYFYDAPFCRKCDTGFHPADVIEVLGLSLEKMTLSERDLSMPGLNQFLQI